MCISLDDSKVHAAVNNVAHQQPTLTWRYRSDILQITLLLSPIKICYGINLSNRYRYGLQNYLLSFVRI